MTNPTASRRTSRWAGSIDVDDVIVTAFFDVLLPALIVAAIVAVTVCIAAG